MLNKRIGILLVCLMVQCPLAMAGTTTPVMLQPGTPESSGVNIQELYGQLKELLGDVEGLSLKVVGGRIVLDGNLLTKAGYEKVAQVAAAYPETILNLTKLDRTELNRFVEHALAKEIGTDTVKVKVLGETAVLEGTVYDQADAIRINEFVKTRVPQVVNLIRLNDVMIETDVYFLQIDYTTNSDFGCNILEKLHIEGGGGIAGSGSAGADYEYNAHAETRAVVNALLGSGTAKILAQPHLSTKSGGEGTFHSGGQVYFSVAGINAGSLEKVDYGIILKVKPTIQGRDKIFNEISVEVSVPSAQPKSTFALEEFKTSSSVLCNVGDSILISGLAQTLASKFGERTPFLGDIPILKMFFGHEVAHEHKRELVVLITPRPVFSEKCTNPPLSAERKKLSLSLAPSANIPSKSEP